MNKRKSILNYIDIDWLIFNNKTILDIGPAYGIWSIEAAKNKGKVSAIDVSDHWINTFKKITRHFGFNIPIIKKDIIDGIEEEYDIVLFLAVLHHIPEYMQAMDVVFSIAKNIVYLECPISNITIFKKHKEFGKEKNRAWYWIPTMLDLENEINNRGFSIVYENYNTDKSRVFIKTIKNAL